MIIQHDASLVVYLMTMGVYDNLQPNYASSLIFELHEINAEFKIKILFKNDTAIDAESDPMEIHLEGT